MAAGPSYKTPAAKKALFDVVGALQGQLDAIAVGGSSKVDDLDDQAPAPAPTPAAQQADPITAGVVPHDNKGKALITPVNVKKLEKAAQTGSPDEVDQVAETLLAKMLSPAKKAAVLNVAAELKGKVQGQPVLEGDGGSGFGDTMASVGSGEVKLPGQETPAAATLKSTATRSSRARRTTMLTCRKSPARRAPTKGDSSRTNTSDRCIT